MPNHWQQVIPPRLVPGHACSRFMNLHAVVILKIVEHGHYYGVCENTADNELAEIFWFGDYYHFSSALVFVGETTEEGRDWALDDAFFDEEFTGFENFWSYGLDAIDSEVVWGFLINFTLLVHNCFLLFNEIFIFRRFGWTIRAYFL